VSEISDGGPAERAGIRVGDVIVSWNGQQVRGAHRLRWDVACAAIGGKVPVEVLRDGKIRKVSVEPRTLPAKQSASLGTTEPAGLDRLGLRLGAPEPAAAILAGAPVGAGVAEVRPEGRAAQAGLQAGDLIVGLGNEPVPGPSELEAVLGAAEPGALLELLVRRGGENVYVPLRVPGS
jgi:serine protease Do